MRISIKFIPFYLNSKQYRQICMKDEIDNIAKQQVNLRWIISMYL